MKEVNEILVANLTKILESPCGTCTQIVTLINETVATLEETLTGIFPNWKNMSAFKDVEAAINDILKFVDAVCPSVQAPRLEKLDLTKPSRPKLHNSKRRHAHS